MSRIYRIGTRSSQLALAQTNMIITALKTVVPDFQHETIEITTTGDKFLGDLSKVGGKGVFVKEIEEALLNNKIDIAMHSMKDVPFASPKGLVIPAMLKRDDIRDIAVCREGKSFEALKDGAKIGTSSLRRASQIRATLPQFEIIPIRGNINTRYKKLLDKEVDAIILAKAGFDRIGWQNKISVVFEPDIMCPAVGQGAVGMQCRSDDTKLREVLAKINHEDTFTCVTAEREMIKALGGDCHTPIAGYTVVTKNNNLRLIALVASPDGSRVLRARIKLPYNQAIELGKQVANELLSQGAADIIKGCAVA